MIETADSLITKLSDVLSINNNILSSTNIMTIIVLITTNASDIAMTISSIIFKSKLIKLKMMHIYKD